MSVLWFDRAGNGSTEDPASIIRPKEGIRATPQSRHKHPRLASYIRLLLFLFLLKCVSRRSRSSN